MISDYGVWACLGAVVCWTSITFLLLGASLCNFFSGRLRSIACMCCCLVPGAYRQRLVHARWYQGIWKMCKKNLSTHLRNLLQTHQNLHLLCPYCIASFFLRWLFNSLVCFPVRGDSIAILTGFSGAIQFGQWPLIQIYEQVKCLLLRWSALE